MSSKRPLLIAAGIAVSFIGLAAGIIYLSATYVVTPTEAKFMLAELLGLYIGFGVLIAVYRAMRNLD
ncbi:MAG: hypothetical protein ABI724_07350 [Betaproteobacteria bacterium]